LQEWGCWRMVRNLSSSHLSLLITDHEYVCSARRDWCDDIIVSAE
jgi:type VI protein secretion system component VasA